jgi:hypothetical protein
LETFSFLFGIPGLKLIRREKRKTPVLAQKREKDRMFFLQIVKKIPKG